MITENLSTLKIHKLTNAQYCRERNAGNIDENALYLTPDESDSSNSIFQLNANSYGEYLPSAGMAGRVFFKRAGSTSGESGGTTTAVTLNTPVFYKDGAYTEYAVVGYDWDNHRRVARYVFSTPNTAVSHVSLKFKYEEFGDTSVSKFPLRFYIGTDPESHVNGGSGSEYAGDLILAGDGISYAGEADVTLNASTQYYLWVFPAVDTYSWWHWQTDTQYAEMVVTG